MVGRGSKAGGRAVRWSVVVAVIGVCAVALPACSSSPGGGGAAEDLAIESVVVPVLRVGQPYSHQLDALHVTGHLHWSVVGGHLPDGVSLGDDGLLSGTPTAADGQAQIRVHDDVDEDLRLFEFLATATSPALTSTGAPLPEGHGLLLATTSADTCDGTCPPWFGSYATTGALAPLTQIGGPESGAPPPAPGLGVVLDAPQDVDGATTGPVLVRDAHDGVVISTLPIPIGTNLGPASIAPDHSAVAITVGSEVSIYDVSTGALRRTVPGAYPIWSPDSDELIDAFPTFPSSTVHAVWSADDVSGGSDRQVSAPDNCNVNDWSGTHRLALACSGSVLTMSETGTDVRVVAANSCPGVPPTWVGCTSFDSSLAMTSFSPSGAHLVAVRYVVTASDPSFVGDVSVVTLKDQASSPVTVLTVAASTTEVAHVFPVAWR
jgi:hypothetical protein